MYTPFNYFLVRMVAEKPIKGRRREVGLKIVMQHSSVSYLWSPNLFPTGEHSQVPKVHNEIQFVIVSSLPLGHR